MEKQRAKDRQEAPEEHQEHGRVWADPPPGVKVKADYGIALGTDQRSNILRKRPKPVDVCYVTDVGQQPLTGEGWNTGYRVLV